MRVSCGHCGSDNNPHGLISNANMNLAIGCLVSIPNQCTVWIDVIATNTQSLL